MFALLLMLVALFITAPSEPAPQPIQNPTGRFVYTREFLLQIKETCKEVFHLKFYAQTASNANAHPPVLIRILIY